MSALPVAYPSWLNMWHINGHILMFNVILTSWHITVAKSPSCVIILLMLLIPTFHLPSSWAQCNHQFVICWSQSTSMVFWWYHFYQTSIRSFCQWETWWSLEWFCLFLFIPTCDMILFKTFVTENSKIKKATKTSLTPGNLNQVWL